MSLLDAENLLSPSQVVTVTANSTNVIDMGAAGRPPQKHISIDMYYDYQRGEFKPFTVMVDGTFAGGTSIVLTVDIDAAEAISSPQTIFTSAAIPTATLVKGYKFLTSLPPLTAAQVADGRYIRCTYTVVGPMVVNGTVAPCTITAGFFKPDSGIL